MISLYQNKIISFINYITFIYYRKEVFGLRCIFLFYSLFLMGIITRTATNVARIVIRALLIVTNHDQLHFVTDREK